MNVATRARIAALASVVALAAWWPAAAALAQAAERPPGFLIVAKPSILDPNFRQTVVLVTEAPDGATLGVILNRPLDRSLADILPGNPTLARFKEPLRFGGPVERAGLFAVFRAKESPGEAFAVSGDLYLALAPDTVDRLLRDPPAQLRFYAGYAGWAPGQLGNELARGDWWVLDADPDVAFRANTDGLWEELARRARATTVMRPRESHAAPTL